MTFASYRLPGPRTRMQVNLNLKAASVRVPGPLVAASFLMRHWR